MDKQQNAPAGRVRSGFRAYSVSIQNGPKTYSGWAILALVFMMGLGTASAQTPSTDPACSSSLFGSSAVCQTPGSAVDSTVPGQTTQTSPNLQQTPTAGTVQPYVDPAGNQFRHTTQATDRNNPTFFPPDPVTDFQKLTRSSTGETLPVFGRDLFQQAPSTFAPADEIPVTQDYVVGPGDEVLVRLFGAESTSSNSQLTVDSSGDIYMPRVGNVHVAGLRASELQSSIGAAVNRVFRNYRISVSLGRLRSIQVYVVGEARRPGAYTVSGLSTMLNALFASGGPSIQGSMRHIELRRGDGVVTDLDLYDLVLRGDKSHDVRLQSGDTIFIPHVGPQVALAGSVRHPAIYELRDNSEGVATTTLNDLLALAGGFSPTAATANIRLERIDGDFRRNALTLALNATSRAMPLRDGDVLYAGHISPGYQKSVTIRGNLANPGRFGWKPGMRLSDIIPDRESLLSNDYWRFRNSLGVPTPLFEPFEFASPVGIEPRNQNTVGVVDRSLNRNAVLPSRQQETQQEQEEQQQTMLAAGSIVSRDSLALDQVANNDIGNRTNSANRTGNDATGSSSSYDNGTSTVSPGANRLQPQQQQQPQVPPPAINRIRIPAPDIDWSYAVIERLDPTTLRTSLIPFNLGKLVQDGDPAQNLELQPNDVVTILNHRDILVPQQEQTKYIRLEGEFAGAGIYSVGPNETLDQLVQRSGGFTPNAYLYGSSFLRESARLLQQQRLDEYITQLSADMDRATAVRGVSSPTGISDPNALTLERNLVAQLRQLRATGRVVLEFAPGSQGVGNVPKIPLENGDVFRVPSRPAVVSVIGAVYGQNVFLYDARRRLQDYLLLAGKTNRIADKDHAFIIRADGSIYSRSRANGVLSNHFDATAINPGDSIVIPERPIKPTTLRQLLDYSQILSSFGLAAAAINVVR